MPTFSPDGADYIARVHRNGRADDQHFEPDELLYHRVRPDSKVGGRSTPLDILPFKDDTGPSVNRGKYSRPYDVLERDCCEGHDRSQYEVLTFRVADVPKEIVLGDQTDRVFQFRLKHAPRECCFAHSEVWCNAGGDIWAPLERPPHSVRLKLRAAILQSLSTRTQSFVPVATEGAASPKIEGPAPPQAVADDAQNAVRRGFRGRLRDWCKSLGFLR